MATIKASNKLFLFRILDEAGDAWKVAYQIDASTEESRTYDSAETKDGAVKAAGGYEASHELTTFLAADDAYIGKLKKLVREAEGKLEVWSIDRTKLMGDSPAASIAGDYSIDVVTSVGESAGADGNVEISISTEVEEGIITGTITVNTALTDLLKRISDELDFEQPTGEYGTAKFVAATDAGVALEYVAIEVDGMTKFTDASGVANFPLPAVEKTWKAAHAGGKTLTPATGEVTVVLGQTKTVEIEVS